MHFFWCLLPVLSGFLWGAVGIFVRPLSAMGMSGAEILSARYAVALAVLFAGMAVWKRSLLKVRLKDAWLFIAAGAVGILGLNICYNEALVSLPLSLAAVLLCLAPAAVAVIAYFLFGERFSKRRGVCMLLSMAACVLVSGAIDRGVQLPPVRGVAMGLLSALFYALYTIFASVCMKRGYHSLTVLFYSFAVAFVPLSMMTDWHSVIGLLEADPAPRGLLFLAHSLCTAVIPYLFFMLSFNYIGVSLAAMLASFEPAAAMILGALFYHEYPSPAGITGMIAAVAALVLLSCPEKERK